MVWACAEEGCRGHWEKNAEEGAARQEEKRKAKDEINGRGEVGNVRGWCDRGRRREQTETQSLQCDP